MTPQQPFDRGEGTAFTNQDMTEMVLRLAHEIRNPLATIKSSIQLMRRLGLSAQAAAPHLESALKNIDRIHETMREIERYVSIQPGTAGAVAVEQAVTRALTAARSQAEERGLWLISPGGPSTRVAIDPQQLQQVLGELLDNAISFSPPGGSIAISWEHSGGLVQIHIDDEGNGVADEHAAHILRPFFSTLTQGIGLGLNVVLRTCTLVGGSLMWENRSCGGCRFTISLREV